MVSRKPSPIKSLLQSRKFWLYVLDATVSLITMGLTLYASAETQKFVLAVLAILQPGVIMVIGSITVQNVAEIRSRK